jgi:diguanylate cyclase (GGDEF)-like protein
VESQSAIVGLIDAQTLVAQAFEGHRIPALRLNDASVPLASIGSSLTHPAGTAISVPGRRWILSVDGGSIPPLQRAAPWLILLLGFGLMLAVARVLSKAGRRRDDAVRIAQRAYDELERRSREDPLTGAFNRRHFGEVLAMELAGPGPGPAVLLLDLDRFKRVNDRYGHLTGDKVLGVATERIASVLRESDCLARWGGEEFAVLAPGIHRDQTAALAERVRRALAEHPFEVDGVPLELTLSVGAAVADDYLKTPDAIVHAADQALYEAKHAGRNCVRVWNTDTPKPESPVRVPSG